MTGNDVRDVAKTTASALSAKTRSVFIESLNEARTFVAADSDRDTARGVALAQVVDNHDRDIFEKPEELNAALLREGLSQADALKLCLMTQVDGFQELVSRRGEAAQVDLDRFARNAREQTGFSREELLGLIKDICYALDVTYDCRQTPNEGKEKDGSVYVIPGGLYKADLEKVEFAIRYAVMKKEKLNSASIDQLLQLVRMGIPRAQYLLGMYLFTFGYDQRAVPQDEVFADIETNEETAHRLALGYLREAADAGDPDAAAMMGDYHFYRNKEGDWGRSYDYYTGYGSVSLTENRRTRVVSLLKRMQLNKTVFIACIALFVLLLLSVIIAPGVPVFPRRTVLGILCLVFSAAALVIVFLRKRKNPFAKLDFAPMVIFALWFIYTFARLV